MPVSTPIVLAPRLAAAAVAVACMAAGAATVAIADVQPVAQSRSSAEPSQSAATRYYDIEANKANSMRALGRYTAEQRVNRTSRYHDLEANKTRSQRAR